MLKYFEYIVLKNKDKAMCISFPLVDYERGIFAHALPKGDLLNYHINMCLNCNLLSNDTFLHS